MAKRNTAAMDEELKEHFSSKYFFRILKYIVPYKWLFIGIFALIILSGGVSLLNPYLRQFIINDVIGNADFVIFYYIIAATVLIVLAEIVVGFLQTRLLSKSAHKIIKKIREDVFAKLQSLGFDYYDNRPAGKVLVRVTSYVDEIAHFFSYLFVSLVVNIVKIVIVVAFMFALNWLLALIVLGVVVPLFICSTFIRKELNKRLRRLRDADSARAAFIHENISGAFVVNSFNRKEKNVDDYINISFQKTRERWLRVVRVSETHPVMIEFFWNIGFLALALASYFLLGSAYISLGLFVSFNGFIAYFQGPILQLAFCLQEMSGVSSYLERIFDLLETKPMIENKPAATELPQIKGEVEFKNVTFGYEESVLVLENFNLKVREGECVALVGPTGGGKSTIMNLLMRFYDANAGEILIDGKNIADVTTKSLRSQIGIMMQDTFIFKTTVMANIRYGKPDASDEECIEAAKAAHAHEFISALPYGYNTELFERGDGLSTGERQLLSFARVLIKKPKILILDEATSSIDSETEIKIQKVLDSILKGRTSFIIAHRLSTIKKADKILYISDKNIQESGNHKELMDKKGLYYNLAKSSTKND